MNRTVSIFLLFVLLLTGCSQTAAPAPTHTDLPAPPATIPATTAPSVTPSPTETTIPPTDTIAPPKETGTVVDFDGHTYQTVKIGGQWWMAESLRVTTNSQGDAITRYCYENDEANCEAYGGLYTWDAAMDGSSTEGAQGLCPDGWHIPSDADWAVLFDYLGGIEIAGGKMKTTGAEWQPPNEGATNQSGFNGLPAGGYIIHLDLFEGFGYGVHFWSSTGNGDKAGLPTINFEDATVMLLNESKQISASVRCVGDAGE